jgi:carboxyl-terminal processing protease
MLKRLLIIVAAVAVGFFGAQIVARQFGAPSWWPNRERDKNVRYFRDVLDTVRQYYVGSEPVSYDELTRAALEGMLGKLDPHSDFMTREEFLATEDEISNQFSGIGIQVEESNGQIVIITPIAGSPAERAGLRRGDRLIAVDGKPIADPSIEQVVKLVRGEPGSVMRLTVSRPGVSQEMVFNIKRERIKLQSVRNAELGADGIGYLQITQFSQRTAEEFNAALTDLEKRGMRALILDLRNNPGGLLDAAIEVSDLFFEKGELVVYTQGRSPQSREEFLAEGNHTDRRYPVAILVNGGTASAAEIVAGAMKDTRRAVIVGEKTFGKGSVQSVISLKNGEGLRLTTARYYTPGGLTIHEKGIQPQVEIEVSGDDEAKVRVQQSRTDLTAPAEFEDRFGFAPIEDVQRNAAAEILKGVIAIRQPGAKQ